MFQVLALVARSPPCPTPPPPEGPPADYRLPPPLLGEHTEEALTDRLGLSAAEIAGLRERGVI